MLLTKFHIIWPSCFRNRTIRNKNCLWRPCLLTDQNGMSSSHRGPSIDASYQVSVYLAKLCRSRRFLEIDQSEKKNCLWRPCLLTDWDKMSNLYKRTFNRWFLPSFGSFGHVVSEEKIFRNRPIRNKNHLWWPCLLMDRDRMSNLYIGTPIDASYQVSDHLDKRFQRRFLEIDQSEIRIACCGLERNEHSLYASYQFRFI
jgi:hypothetical protein